MAPAARPVPEGYHTITPYLCCRNATDAIEFYKRALGASELFAMKQPDGRIGHAELQVGTSRVMLADEFPEMGFRSPESIGGSPVHLHVYVEEVDAAFDRAVQAGGEVLRPLKDQFYGDRSGSVKDPFGHVWHLSTHKEDLSPEEIAQRAKQQHQSG
jgi:PhnB protein